MRKIHRVLRLFFEAGLSIRAIARSIQASPSTVGDYIRRAHTAGLSWPLLDAGALVAAGADNVQDPFNLMGRSDPLETAALMVMAGHRLPADAYDMVSNTARRVMGLAPVNFEPGDPADLVAIDAPSLRGAVADAPMSRRVYRRGLLVASADQQTRVMRAG